jgi:hypothetical protein
MGSPAIAAELENAKASPKKSARVADENLRFLAVLLNVLLSG